MSGAFEYRAVDVATVGETLKGNADAVEDRLNELGRNGWEAFGVVDDDSGAKLVLLKRPLED